MSVDDTRAIQRLDRQMILDAVLAQINTAWDVTEALPEDQKTAIQGALTSVWEHNQALVELLEVDEAVMAEAQALISGLQAMTTTLATQRDQALHDLDQIIQAAQNPWGTDHPVIAPLYDEIMEAHNSAFWESLPYDMADVLGGEWSFMEADDLHSAITMHLEEKEEGDEDYGYTKEQLVNFRTRLLQLLRDLHNGGDHD